MSEHKHAHIVGPFDRPAYSHVVVNGCRVPHIEVLVGTGANDGKLEVLLDDRMTFIITNDEDTEVILSLLANAMAVAAGYPCMGAAEKMNPFNVKMVGIEPPTR